MARQTTLFDVFPKQRQNVNDGVSSRSNAQAGDSLNGLISRSRSGDDHNSGQERRRKKAEWLKPAEEGVTYYLLQVDYDGEKAKALLKLYDPIKQEIRVLYDSTGHKPYFLIDLDIDKASKIVKLIKDPSFDHFEKVTKYDPYYDQKRTLTNVVVKDPLAVRRMREVVPKAYEAHIKYHNNYVYDLGLIPGMPYKVVGSKLVPVAPEVTEEDKKEIEKALSDAPESTRKLAVKWTPIFEAPVPNIKRAALDIEVYTPTKGRIPDPQQAEFPIISISLVGNDGVKKVFVLARKDVEDNTLEKPNGAEVKEYESEKEMLQDFFKEVLRYPLLLTFNGDNFDIPYLITRSLKLGIPLEDIPFKDTGKEGKYLAGIHIDLYRFFFNKAVKNYVFGGKYTEYTLDAIAQAVLGESKVKIDTLVSFLDLRKLIEYNLHDSEITLELTTFNDNLVWKLIVLLARLSKLGIEELTRTEVSNWIKNLYYWEHRQRGWLIPLKEDILARTSQVKTTAIIKGKGYKGAVVINPPQGVFFNIVVLDFASLYPSVIRNWNLSYETVDVRECKNIKEIRDETGQVLHTVCFDRQGITAEITGLLRDFRVKIYKKKAKNTNISPEQKSLYDVVQSAMKVFINATYGVFGAESFPLYAPAVAESTTALGRLVITSTVAKAKELGLKVLYGDTDSLFLLDPPKDKLEELIRYVKETYGLDLELDKTYKFVAFSGLKKNYLGVYPDGKIEIKGMLAKKRNTPEFLKKAFSDVTRIIASMNSEDDIEKTKKLIMDKIKEVYFKLKNKEYYLDDLAFRIMLSKPLDSYTKNTPQHVKAALLLKYNGVNVQPRDVISFVKVKTKDGVKPIQLAKLSEVDIDKYVEHVRSTFEQLIEAFGTSWNDVVEGTSILSFLSPLKK
ncbi:MAG: DNA-directed DNA polymerase I [Sulfolobaceae archaeon]|nr:DNA-directed DNA polymerase I [Sulfolobales archaeon]